MQTRRCKRVMEFVVLFYKQNFVCIRLYHIYHVYMFAKTADRV